MAFISRRDAGKLLLAGCAGALRPARKLCGATMINSVIRGVQIGAQSFSFRDRPLDACIDAFREVGLGECELSPVPNTPSWISGVTNLRGRVIPVVDLAVKFGLQVEPHLEVLLRHHHRCNVPGGELDHGSARRFREPGHRSLR